ncbi:MAG: hypothetical protein KF802_06225 [Bdellovibrionaceae bacterium]|nr:hypothetical protein [Pseudobdellovibrionaceae bacterium]MBX3032518.1 hypothetical protein [Pseudobdellovibrionaceae bacterium]
MRTTLRQMGMWTVIGSLAVACAKPRDAAFPAETAPEIYSLSEFSDPEQQTVHTVSMQAEGKVMTAGESALAISEKGLSLVDTSALNVPERFKYMFEELVLQGTPGQTFRVSFVVDRKNLTVYKVVLNPEELTTLEKAMMTTPGQIKAELGLQKSRSMAESNKLFHALREQKVSPRALSNVYVPLFQLPVEAFGVVARAKNELKEETSTLKLEKSAWEKATHVKIPQDLSKRKLFGVTDALREKMADVFVAGHVHGQTMMAGTLLRELGLRTDLPEQTALRLNLQEKSLVIEKVAGTEAIAAFEAGVVYKKAVLPEVKIDGTRASELTLEDLPAGQVSPLVQIKKDSLKAVGGGAAAEAKK